MNYINKTFFNTFHAVIVFSKNKQINVWNYPVHHQSNAHKIQYFDEKHKRTQLTITAEDIIIF